jgi:hypothetical protein
MDLDAVVVFDMAEFAKIRSADSTMAVVRHHVASSCPFDV